MKYTSGGAMSNSSTASTSPDASSALNSAGVSLSSSSVVEVRRSSRRSNVAAASAAESDDSPLKKRSRPQQQQQQQQPPHQGAGEAVERCAICLCDPVDPSYTWSCLHRYCFACLLEWAKRKPECPQCKRPFTTIIHNVRTDTDYDECPVPLPPAPAPPPVWTLGAAVSSGVGNSGAGINSNPLFTSRAGPFHLYRPLVDEESGASVTQSPRQQQQQSSSQSSELNNSARANYFAGLQTAESPVWQSGPAQYLSIFDFQHEHHQRGRHGLAHSAGYGGVPALPYENEDENAADADEPLPNPLTGADRHLLYLRRLYPEPDPEALTEVTAEHFASNESDRHRLVPFLLRELRVLTRYDAFSIQRIVHHILRLVSSHELGSAVFHRLARAYVGRHARLFCINLAHYSAASACRPTLAQYDAAVKYVRLNGSQSDVQLAGDVADHQTVVDDSDPALSVELKCVSKNLRPGPTPLEPDDSISPIERDFTALTPRQRPMILTRLGRGDSVNSANDTTASNGGGSNQVYNYMQLLHSVTWQFTNPTEPRRQEQQQQQQQQQQQTHQQQENRPSSPWPDYVSDDSNSLLGAALLAPFEAVVAAAAAAAVVVSTTSSSSSSSAATAAAVAPPNGSSSSSWSPSFASASPPSTANILTGGATTPKRNSAASGFHSDPIAATPLLSHLLNATPSSSSSAAAAAAANAAASASASSGNVRIASLAANASDSATNFISRPPPARLRVRQSESSTPRHRPLFDDHYELPQLDRQLAGAETAAAAAGAGGEVATQLRPDGADSSNVDAGGGVGGTGDV